MARRALVVDDDPLVLELVVSMLEELGCETLLARSLATHLVDRGIRVNGVAPGPVWTPLR
jgi:CheY-like chemotaxis protein